MWHVDGLTQPAQEDLSASKVRHVATKAEFDEVRRAAGVMRPPCLCWQGSPRARGLRHCSRLLFWK